MNNTDNTYNVFSFDSEKNAFSLMPSRPKRSCKGDFGRVLCVCGSNGMAGAAYLCAKAAYRMGAGIVEIFTHESNRIILQTLLPEAIVSTWGENYSSNDLLSSLERADCAVAGCGLGVTIQSRKILSDLLHAANTSKTHLILDADALNLIARNPALKKYTKGAIITPHAKEMSRICGFSIEDILSSPADAAYEYAKKHSLVCVLKDHESVASDGTNRLYKNTTGNSGMATGGSGDVLSGMLAGLLSQSKNSQASLLDTVALGVYIHGLCGDFASKRMTEYCVMASDIIDEIPNVLNFYIQTKSY